MAGRFLTCGLLIGLALPAVAQQNRIHSRIDDSRTVLLSGQVPHLAGARNDLGEVEAGFPIAGITLTLARSAAQQAELDQLLAAQQNPSSPHFHQWLTPEQFADRFGASRSDLAQIEAWLHGQGFTLDYTARSRTYLTFSGTAQQAQNTFHTRIHRYNAGGQTHYANVDNPSIPAALAEVVAAVQGLHDFHPRPLYRAALPQLTSSFGEHYLGPADFAAIYDVVPLYSQGIDGTGQKIAVVGQAGISTSDIDAFRAKFNLGPKNLDLRLVPNSPLGFGDAGSTEEADLDIEWSGAVAPKASIVYVYSQDAWTSAMYVVDNGMAPVLSFSFGYGCELYDLVYLSPWRATVQQANAEGITMLVATGDIGAAGCEFLDNPFPVIAQSGLGVSEPASIPEVTAMGGSEFDEGSDTYWNTDGSAMSYIPERVWNDTGLVGAFLASGGGASIYFAQPAWQTGPGVPNDGARHLPDLSFPASNVHDPVYIYTGGGGALVGGTSCAAPMMAGVMALLNQYLVSNNLQKQPGVGNINPALYRMAQSTSGVFHDIVEGDNKVPCADGSPDCVDGLVGWAAGPGYDSATGLGSLDVASFLSQWSSAAPVNASVVASINQNPVCQVTPDASGNSWRFQLRLTEEAGIGVTVTGFTINGASYSSQIASLFGTAAIPAGGSIFASYGFQNLPDPSNVVFGFSGVDAGGAAWSTTLTVPFQGPQTQMAVYGASNNASGQQAYAPGMIVSVYGAGMGNFAQAAGATPLPSMLAGFEAWVANNGGDFVSAPLYYVSPDQVNLQIPYAITPGPAQLYLGGPWGGVNFPFTVTPAAPGIFMFADGSVNPSRTARAGDTVVIYVTGDGQVSPPLLAGWTPSNDAVPVPQLPVSITVGGIAVAQPFAFIGIPGWSVGVTQINFAIPATVAPGPQPVVVTVGSAPSLPATITIVP